MMKLAAVFALVGAGALNAGRITVEFDLAITGRLLTIGGNGGVFSHFFMESHAPVSLVFDSVLTGPSYYWNNPIDGKPMSREDRYDFQSVSSALLSPANTVNRDETVYAYLADVTSQNIPPSLSLQPYYIYANIYAIGPTVFFDGSPWDSFQLSFGMHYNSQTAENMGLADRFRHIQENGEGVDLSFTDYYFYSPGNYWAATYNGTATISSTSEVGQTPEPAAFAIVLVSLLAFCFAHFERATSLHVSRL